MATISLLFGQILQIPNIVSAQNAPTGSPDASKTDKKSSTPVVALPEQNNTTSPTISRKLSPKIINGELDLESDIKISGVEKQNFDECKKEEKSYRSSRNTNKPTACIKQPQAVNSEFTDQVYTTLFDRIQEKKDVDDKKT